MQRVARTYAASKPAAIQWGVALDQQTGGQQAAHAITALWCITGNLDVPGGNVMGDACWGIEQPNWTGTWGWDELMTEEEQSKRIGVERSRGALERAELGLVLVDGSGPLTAEHNAILKLAQSVPQTIVLATKADRPAPRWADPWASAR